MDDKSCSISNKLLDALILDLSSVQYESLDSVMVATLENLKRTLLSKCVDDESPDAMAATRAGFETSQQICREWSLRCETDRDANLIRSFESLAAIEDLGLSFIDFHHMFMEGSVGQGRAAGTKARVFYQKMLDDVLTTSHSYLVPMYNRYVSLFPEWQRAEQRRASLHGAIRVIPGSIMSTVPKKRTIRRTTCKEPSLDMFFQLGLGSLITKRLRMLGISLKDQPYKNRGMARTGSINGSFATIDLKDASNRISLGMARKFFPRVAGLINMVSCRTTSWEGRVIDLHMLSTMGNGATFPFQTLLFVTVVRSVLKLNGIEFGLDRHRPLWGVFGDDIVVPTVVFDDVCRLCNLLGLEVNADKSYSTGSFRESCGGDFMNGCDIRGLYIKTLRSTQDRYNAANRLLAFGAKHGFYFHAALQCLIGELPRRLCPMWADVTCGLRAPWAATDMSGRYKAWRSSAAQIQLDMTGDKEYVAFLAGYLRTPAVRRDTSTSYRYTCVEQGVLGLPSDEDDRSYTLRRQSCPEALWDGFAGSSGNVNPAEYRRLFEAVISYLVRDTKMLYRS